MDLFSQSTAHSKSLMVGTYIRRLNTQTFVMYRSLFLRTEFKNGSIENFTFKNESKHLSACEVDQDVIKNCSDTGYLSIEVPSQAYHDRDFLKKAIIT